MAAITIRNLDKAYGKTRVLHGINLDIADNSFVVFVGPSGCGKSTLLRTIAGLEEKERGEIMLDGRDISDEAPVDRDVAMVFQSYALYPQMSVAENIGFALSVARNPRRRSTRRSMKCRSCCGSTTIWRASPRPCPAGSGSASPSAAPSCATRKCSCSTSR